MATVIVFTQTTSYDIMIEKGIGKQMNYTEMTESEFNNLILNRINDYMHKNGIKQLELAKQSKINQSTLSKLMKGETKLTIQHVFKICKALKINPEILMSLNQEITTENMQKIDEGVINTNYINEQILIRETTHPAFKGYLGNMFYIYFYSTISSESSLLEGEISFEDTKNHNFCKASLLLYTGHLNSDGDKITKNYYGEFIISLTMGACYCILINSEIGEICTINFKHTFLFNQKLICRVGTINSTSSGQNRLPIIQRALLTDRELNVNDVNSPDFEFVRGQLKLNESEIVIPSDSLEKIIRNRSFSEELRNFLETCNNEKNGFSVTQRYDVYDETKIRSINTSSSVKAEGISLLRNLSVSPKYNKISTKTEEFTFQYITNKSDSPHSDNQN